MKLKRILFINRGERGVKGGVMKNEWIKIESVDDLSIGEIYFVGDAKGKFIHGLGEFDGCEISTEAELFDLEAGDLEDLRFMLFEWPDPPTGEEANDE